MWNIFQVDRDFKNVCNTFGKVAGNKQNDGPNRNQGKFSVFIFLPFSGNFSEEKQKIFLLINFLICCFCQNSS